MGHKYHSDTGAKIESITYTPGIQESSDLEAATRNISSFVEPGSPDYNTTLVAPTPDDDRLQVLRIAVRLQATVDSWAESGTVLNYRIKRNGLSVGTGTLTDAGATGDLFIAHDITEPAGNLTGSSSYDIFLWVNTGSCVISVVKVWGGVGTTIVGHGNPFPSCILLESLGFVLSFGVSSTCWNRNTMGGFLCYWTRDQ